MDVTRKSHKKTQNEHTTQKHTTKLLISFVFDAQKLYLPHIRRIQTIQMRVAECVFNERQKKKINEPKQQKRKFQLPETDT